MRALEDLSPRRLEYNGQSTNIAIMHDKHIRVRRHFIGAGLQVLFGRYGQSKKGTVIPPQRSLVSKKLSPGTVSTAYRGGELESRRP